ncbi:MAG TPA: hypothetical protein VEI02_03475, partial [Planctomycetota bacterium]|nr:hypothetical protein [Planctomycetota bacterium]
MTSPARGVALRILHVAHRSEPESAGGVERHVAELTARQASEAGGGHAPAIFRVVRRPDAPDFSFVDDGAVDGVRR